jgi:hypothetical protein
LLDITRRDQFVGGINLMDEDWSGPDEGWVRDKNWGSSDNWSSVDDLEIIINIE